MSSIIHRIEMKLVQWTSLYPLASFTWDSGITLDTEYSIWNV